MAHLDMNLGCSKLNGTIGRNSASPSGLENILSMHKEKTDIIDNLDSICIPQNPD
jgi:hypothetical protein